MSTFSDNHLDTQSSAHFTPPESGQPFRSLFGGPSSQDVDLEPYAETQEDGEAGNENDDDLDVIMGEPPLIEEDFSDDATYRESDEDGYGSDGASSDEDARNNDRKKGKSAVVPQPATRSSNSPPSESEYRPNRFTGPDSTWRKLTIEERQNAQALETIRARDLAAHLYNAYALRVRAREIAQQGVEDEAVAFLPPKRWTAWPMPANEIPRIDECLRREDDDAWTVRMQPDPRPSAELEESIMAFMMKSGKERFLAREWETRRSVSQPQGGRGARTEDLDASTGNEEEWASEVESLDGRAFRPVVQADEDKSQRQLRPLTRNMITKLDQLLMGLHNARQGGVAADDSSASEWQTDTESVISERSPSPRKRRASGDMERSQSRGRKRTRRSSRSAHSTPGRSRSVRASSGAASSRQTSHLSSMSRGRSVDSDRRRSASRLRLGVRDWSEVLGIASMIGWPPAVVMRTAQRCSALFGEDMVFQTLKEGRMQQVEEGNRKIWEYSESESEEEPPTPPPPPRSRPSSKRSRSRAVSSRATSVSRPSSPASDRPKGKGEHRKQDLICPLKLCPRHEDGFSRTWNLNLHMKRMHPNYRSKSRDSKPASKPRAPNKIDDHE